MLFWQVDQIFQYFINNYLLENITAANQSMTSGS